MEGLPFTQKTFGAIFVAAIAGLIVLFVQKASEGSVATPYVLVAAIILSVTAGIWLTWALRHPDNRAKLRQKCRQPITWAKSLEPSKMIIGGLIVIVVGVLVGVTMIGIGVWHQSNTVPGAEIARTPSQGTFTPGIGTPLAPHRELIKWNEIFGTTRSIDLVFALFLDGIGPENKSIKLKDAFIESASQGNVIHMQVVGTDNPLDEAFPISEANPVPPDGFIRLIAHMNELAPEKGVPNKEFLERWRKIWFNAVYEDGKVDRIEFDTSGYFPGLTGPRVTRKDAKKQ